MKEKKETPALLFLGGDRRMDAAAALFPGSRRLFGAGPPPSDAALAEALAGADGIVLPLPGSRDKLTLHAPLCGDPPTLAALFSGVKEKLVFAGSLPPEREKALESAGNRLLFYGQEEIFLRENASLTAEALALRGILPPPGSPCGITGFGRVAKATAALCAAKGCPPILFCRRAEACREAENAGYTALPLRALPHPILRELPLLLNTVPAPILGARELAGFEGRYGELAFPGGLRDNALPEERILRLPGLPGLLPEAAGAALAGAVRRLWEGEEELPC